MLYMTMLFLINSIQSTKASFAYSSYETKNNSKEKQFIKHVTLVLSYKRKEWHFPFMKRFTGS